MISKIQCHFTHSVFPITYCIQRYLIWATVLILLLWNEYLYDFSKVTTSYNIHTEILFRLQMKRGGLPKARHALRTPTLQSMGRWAEAEATHQHPISRLMLSLLLAQFCKPGSIFQRQFGAGSLLDKLKALPADEFLVSTNTGPMESFQLLKRNLKGVGNNSKHSKWKYTLHDFMAAMPIPSNLCSGCTWPPGLAFPVRQAKSTAYWSASTQTQAAEIHMSMENTAYNCHPPYSQPHMPQMVLNALHFFRFYGSHLSRAVQRS